jgi:predicted acylesterase/phospholipase RssA
MQYLAQRYDLTRVPMAGASGGAICAALARCGVCPDRIASSAYALSRHHKIWDKPMGLAGGWGSVIEQWLHDILPDDAHDRCSGGLGVIVTQLPTWRQLSIQEFESKADLINCVMASAHVPLLLDMQLSRSCRGVACVDGSFPDFFTGENCDFLQVGDRLVC